MARFGLKQLLIALGFFVIAGASSAQAQAPFGALAVAPDGAYGYSYNFDDIDAAQDRAMEECRKHARSGCQIIRVYQNACVAIARHLEGKDVLVNWVSGYTQEERTRRALRNCREDGGSNCKITTEFCTGKAR
jgi:hypothetical protein